MKLKTKFQDEDFNLGEVVEANVYYGGNGRVKVIAEPTKGGMITFYFESLKGLNEMFEDAPEEPKVYYYISDFGAVRECEIGKFPEDEEDRKAIGNYFETKEEAEKAVEKLKAWKRLKDKGFRFWTINPIHLNIGYSFENYTEEDIPELKKDLYFCFGGEK